MIGRRALLGAGAGTVLAAAAVAATGSKAHATPQTNAGSFRRIIVGASVTRLAASAPDGLRYQIPWLAVDGLDDSAKGGTSYPIDGRGLLTPATGTTMTLLDGVLSEISRNMLRQDSGDWCIVEWSHGAEPATAVAPVVDQIVAAVTARGCRLAWVVPHVYYTGPNIPAAATSPATQLQWNADARALLLDKVAPVAGAVLIDWWGIVRGNTSTLPSSAAQVDRDVFKPLLYDGRHPTGNTPNTGRGALRFGAAVADATGV